MAVDNTQLKNNVLRDKLVIQEMLKNYTDTDVYPFATFSLFSRFVELEQFIINSYIKYALGEISLSGFKPCVEINFKDEETLRVFHKPIDKFITVKTIKETYTYMFGDGSLIKNPFESLFKINYGDYERLESIRNVIAHRSQEAYEKFFNKCTSGATCSIDDYLYKYNGAFTNYNKWLKFIVDITDAIITPI